MELLNRYICLANKTIIPKIEMCFFSYRIRFLGLALIIVSFPFAYLYFWGGRPEFFNVKIYALVSAYLETRYFVVAQTNILDEVAAVFFIAGLTLFSFSKERKEKVLYNNFRVKALFRAVLVTSIFWMLGFLLIYGMAIFIISSFVFIFYLICYNIIFRYYIYRDSNSNNS